MYLRYFLSFRSIFLKEKLLPVIPAVQQITDGLKTFGLLSKIKDHSPIFKPVFCGSEELKWNFDIVEEMFLPSFSEAGSNKKELEVDCYKAFLDGLEMLYHSKCIAIKSIIFFIIFYSLVCKLLQKPD